LAQAIVFFSSIATVTGPTPPGTGVIADAMDENNPDTYVMKEHRIADGIFQDHRVHHGMAAQFDDNRFSMELLDVRQCLH